MVIVNSAEPMDVENRDAPLTDEERNALLFVEPTASATSFQPSEPSAGVKPEEEDDDFFELTADDLRARQRELAARVRMETNRPLLPRAYVTRKDGELKRRAYHHTVVRFALPRQRVVVQARFLSTEPVSELFDFADRVLSQHGGFELQLGREKLASDDRRTLLAAGVAPASRLAVHVSNAVTDCTAAANALARRVTEADADEDRRQWLAANSDYQSFERQLVDADVELRADENAATTKRAAALILGRPVGGQRPSGSSVAPSHSGGGSGGAPKWFKKN